MCVGDADGGLNVHGGGGDADGGERDGQRQRGGGGGGRCPVGSGHGWKRTTGGGTAGHGRDGRTRTTGGTAFGGAGASTRARCRAARSGHGTDGTRRARAHGIGGAGVSIFMHIRARAGGRARLSDDAYAAREITRPGRSNGGLERDTRPGKVTREEASGGNRPYRIAAIRRTILL